MKTMIFKIALTLFVFVICTVVGVGEVLAHRIGMAVFTFLLGASNLPLAYLHYWQYKKQKELRA